MILRISRRFRQGQHQITRINCFFGMIEFKEKQLIEKATQPIFHPELHILPYKLYTVISCHWGARDAPPPPPPRASNFFQFHAVLGEFGKITHSLEGSHPHLGEILDPPLVAVSVSVSGSVNKPLRSIHTPAIYHTIAVVITIRFRNDLCTHLYQPDSVAKRGR